jgi:hypothetical protein
VQGYFSFLDAFQRGHAEEYADIEGVLERHATLRDAHSDLLAEQARIMSEIEEQRRHVTRVQKAASMQLLNSENTSARLKAHLEEARALAGAMQAGADEGAVRKGLRVLELGQVLQSVYNLHSRCVNCAHGAVLRHSPADGAVLGLGGGFRGPEDEGGSEDEGDEGEEEEGPGGGSSVRRGAAAGRTAPGAPSATSSPSLRGSTRPADAGGVGGGGEQDEEGEEALIPHVATPDPISSRDLAAMNPRVVRRRLRQAMSLLNVVGSFIADFSDMAADFPAWQAEQRRRQGERDALAAEESRRLAAARAAREAGAGGAGSDTSRLLLRGGKPVPPAVAAALASGAGLPSGVRLSLSVSGARAFAAAGSSAGVASGGVAMGHQPLAAGTGAGPFTGKGGAKIWAVRGAHLPPAVVAKLQAGALAATLTDRDGSDAAASSSGGAAFGITAGTSAAPAAATPGYSGPATSVTPARLGAAGRKPVRGR